jgi:predicted nucleotidyltransferase
MKRDEALTKLKRQEATLKQLGVEHLYMLGSTERGDARDSSNIVLYFDHVRGKIGLYELIAIIDKTRTILEPSTEIMTKASLHPVLKEWILKTAAIVY